MSALLAAIAGSLLNVAVPGALLAVAFALLFRLLPQATARLRSVVWTAVFALLVLLHFLPRTAASSTRHVQPAWALAVVCVWAAASAWRALRLAAAFLHLGKLCSRSVPLGRTVAVPRRRAAMLCVSAEVFRPTVVGFFHPRVLLPQAMHETLSEAELNYVLLHEITHLRRADDWTNLLQKLALTVFPLDPALLWIERQLCREREFVCDDYVIAQTGSARNYAVCLTSLAERGLFARASSLALGAWQRRSELVERVERMLQPRRDNASHDSSRRIGGVLCAGLAVAALAVARLPQIVSFTQPAAMAAVSVPATADLTAPVGGARMVLASARVLSSPTHQSGKHLPVEAARTGLQRASRRRLTQQPLRIQTTGYVQGRSRTNLHRSELVFLRDRTDAFIPSPAFVPVTAYAVATPEGWFVITL